MYIIPTEDLDTDKRARFRKEVIENLVYFAMHELNLPKEVLSLRDLLAEDLGLLDWTTPKDKQWINTPISNRTYIGIYKLLQLNAYPSITVVEFWVDRSRIAKVGIESCYSGLPILERMKEALLDPVAREVMNRLTDTESKICLIGSKMEGYFSEPIIIKANAHFEVNIYHREEKSDYLILGGFVVEPKGMTVV